MNLITLRSVDYLEEPDHDFLSDIDLDFFFCFFYFFLYVFVLWAPQVECRLVSLYSREGRHH